MVLVVFLSILRGGVAEAWGVKPRLRTGSGIAGSSFFLSDSVKGKSSDSVSSLSFCFFPLEKTLKVDARCIDRDFFTPEDPRALYELCLDFNGVFCRAWFCARILLLARSKPMASAALPLP